MPTPTIRELRAALTEPITAAITALLEYNWAAECEDYKDNPDTDHVFAKMIAIDNWLNVTAYTPDEQAGIEHTEDEE